MSRILRRPGVDDDIFDLALFLSDRSNSVAERFIDAVQKSLKDLAATPTIGSPKEFNDPALAEVRTWWVQGFPNHLIYYIAIKEGIDVLAILHGARDAEKLLHRRST